MDENSRTIAVFEGDDGILMFGAPGLLATLDAQPGLITRKLPAKALGAAGQALGAVGTMQEHSGRWVKLTKESADFVKANGVKNIGAGVLRGKDLAGGQGGQIAKHLRFETAALATPAGPAVLAALMTQAAMEKALDEIKEYLATVDAKLDQLLKQRKLETLGQLGGVTLAIEEAASISTHTGTMSGVTWSKVQANSLALQTMQAEAVAQLCAVADLVKEQSKVIDKSAEALATAQEDASFWLGVLARTLALQDRQYVLELARVPEEDPDQLEGHRQGIRVARQERTHRIGQALDAISGSVRECADLSNFTRMVNPFSAQQVVRRANTVNETIGHFAAHVDLEINGVDELEETPWRHAAQAVLGGAATRVGSAGVNTAVRAKKLGGRLQEHRDNVILAKAQKVQEKRRALEEGAED